jgi:ferredoxin
MLEQIRIRDLLSQYAGADMARCLEGEIDQDMAFAIGDEELEQGLRLICIGSPLSDVVLDA